MSTASNRTVRREKTRSERLQSWIGLILSILLHVLFLLILLHEAPPTFTPSQGARSGSRMKMEFVGRTTDPAAKTPPNPAPTNAPTPPSHAAAKKRVAQVQHKSDHVQATVVKHAAPPLAADSAAPIPSTSADDSWSMPKTQAQPSQPTQTPASPPPPSPDRAATWGRPPGMQDQDTAQADVGMDDSPDTDNGTGHAADSNGPSLALGGYGVYYQTRSEATLRAWLAQGKKEFFMPLPGTRYYMVCSLKIVERHGSGKCRALLPESPEMSNIGDGRDIIDMTRVYKKGELLWSGPGPYR